MFEDKNTAVRAEKLSHILEALEKLKVTANSRYESAFGQVCVHVHVSAALLFDSMGLLTRFSCQITKFSTDWELLKAELLQVGHIYDEGVAANLEQVRACTVTIYCTLSKSYLISFISFCQCRLACDHQAKLFAYDQLKFSAEVKRVAMKQLRAAVISELMTDTCT